MDQRQLWGKLSGTIYNRPLAMMICNIDQLRTIHSAGCDPITNLARSTMAFGMAYMRVIIACIS